MVRREEGVPVQKVPTEELKEMREIFAMFDEDGSGSIDVGAKHISDKSSPRLTYIYVPVTKGAERMSELRVGSITNIQCD
jgi:hypothetical protein